MAAPVPSGVSDRQLPPAAASLSFLNCSQQQSKRPMFEVITPHGVIVREKIETASRRICTLACGSKVIVVDARMNGEGAHRVCIRLRSDFAKTGVQTSLGWITAQTQERGETNVLIREVTEEATLPHEHPSTGRDLLCSARNSARATPLSARSSHSVPTDSRDLGSARGFGRARAHSADYLPTPRSFIFHSSTPGTPGFTRRHLMIDAAKAAREAAEGSFRSTQSSFRSIRSGGSITARIMGSITAAGEEPKVPRAADSPNLSSPNKAKKRSGKLDSASLLLTSADLEGFAVNLQQQVDTLVKGSQLEKTVAVMLGEVLLASNVKLALLVKQWAKNGEEPISKMEFRQRVRKLLPKVDTTEIDALFVEWDDDGGGCLDLNELKDALKRCCASAAKYEERSVITRSKISRLQERMTQAREAAAAMAAVEHANESLNLNQCVESRLGTLLLEKTSGSRISDLVRKWDTNGDGSIDADEFKLNVKKLGLVATNFEIDQLFHDLDVDGGGSLDADELKKAIRMLMESRSKDIAREKELRQTMSALSSSARALQAELRKRDQEEEAAAEEDARQAMAAQSEKKEAARQAMVAKSAKVMANAPAPPSVQTV